MKTAEFVKGTGLEFLQVTPGSPARIRERDTGWMGTPEMCALGEAKLKDQAKDYLEDCRKELSDLQERLYADDRHSVLMVFQAMDAAGKDGTIEHVFSGVNPAGCQVVSFKAPSAEELDHTFLWRVAKALPERGRIGIFNRSHYEEVLVVRVHPEFLEKQRLPAMRVDAAFWQARCEDINAFERHLDRNGTVVLKFFLHVSREEQRRRFLDRLKDPEKHWKFSYGDLEESRLWDAYMDAYEEMLSRTSTPWAPWHIIPADHKWVMRALVSHVIVSRLQGLGLRFPEANAEKKAAIERALKELRAEEKKT
ncbi:MAG TPA: polyphosphate kinase 2 family protein [Alphaproteobacteria bacterium]|nr:polyphosphate kinase 2 family protein [Alphaproteobacteria bacterium]